MPRPRNKELKIYDHPDGRKMAYVYLLNPSTGREKRTPVYGRTEEEVLEEAGELQKLAKQVSGKYARGSVEEFIETIWRPSKIDIRNASKDRFFVDLDQHIIPGLGHLQIAAVTYKDLIQFAANLRRKDGRPGELAKKTRRGIISLVKQIFKLWHHLEQKPDPAELLQLPKIARKTIREEPEDDFSVKLLAAARNHPRDSWIEGPIWAALFLGFRRGETAGLKKPDVDREHLTITIRSQRHPAYPSDVSPKNDSVRVIPITAEILAWLDRFSQHDSIYVFVQGAGKPIYVNEVTEKCPALCLEAGLRRTAFRDLRSYAASNLMDLTGDPFLVAEILGHSTLDTTRLYVNSKKKAKRSALGKMLEDGTVERVNA